MLTKKYNPLGGHLHGFVCSYTGDGEVIGLIHCDERKSKLEKTLTQNNCGVK